MNKFWLERVRIPPMEKLGDIIFSEEQIQARVAEIAAEITNDYKDKQDDGIVVVGLLRGAIIFMADVIRHLDLVVQIDFISASSYKDGMESCGNVDIEMDIKTDIAGKHVIICEDIVDTGLTLNCICNMFKDRGAASVKICTFLFKKHSKYFDHSDYNCFDCPDEFIVGYGLDYAQKYRNLPYVTSICLK